MKALDHHENVIPNLKIGVRFYESNVNINGYVPFHWHSSIELVFVMKGKLLFNFDGKTHPVYPNQFIVVSSGVIHDVTNTPNQSLVLQIPLQFIEPYLTHPEKLNFKMIDNNSQSAQIIMALLQQLNATVQTKTPSTNLRVGIIILQIMQQLIDNFAQNQEPISESTSYLKDIIVYINNNFTQQLKVQDLARMFDYNASYLSRLFKQQTDITITQYIYKLRLTAFYQDLIDTDLPIKDLMNKYGLKNPRTTRNLFKKMYGKLPIQVRQEQTSL